RHPLAVFRQISIVERFGRRRAFRGLGDGTNRAIHVLGAEIFNDFLGLHAVGKNELVEHAAFKRLTQHGFTIGHVGNKQQIWRAAVAPGFLYRGAVRRLFRLIGHGVRYLAAQLLKSLGIGIRQALAVVIV